MSTPEQFSFRETTTEDRTYVKRLNYLADVFGDETVTPDSKEFLEGTNFYIGKWGPRNGVLVVDDDLDNPAGAAWYIFGNEENHGVGYVEEAIPELAIAVEKRYQRNGLGAELLRCAAEQAEKRGCPGISLCVHHDNAGARRLYEREGFEVVGEREDNYVAMVMRF